VADAGRHGEAGGTSYRRLAFGIAAAVIAADQIAKQLATRLLPQDGPVHLFGGVHLQLFRNFAGPGGHFAGHAVLISVFTVIAAIALIAFIARSRLDRVTAIALGLFLGGAVGNGLDRLLRAPGPLHGGVIDWLSLSANGASMNLADLSLNAAVVVLIAGALLSMLPTKKRRRRVDPDAAA
jgi:signal peptidase II